MRPINFRALAGSPEMAANMRRVCRLGVVAALVIVLFSVGFNLVMATEGREFGWASSVYWTMVTMTTLGYGDIVFESELGRAYSVLVLTVGALLLLALLPFTVIQLVYLPWSRALRRSRAPREVNPQLAHHVILIGLGPVQQALISRLCCVRRPFVVLVSDVEEAVRLIDEGYPVVVGAVDDPVTYRRLRAEAAAMLFTAGGDTLNTNVAFTLREVAPSTPIVATASSGDAAEILELAGCDQALRLGQLLGGELAHRIMTPGPRGHVVATFGDVVLAEISAAGTCLVGQRLTEIAPVIPDLRCVGIWDRGTLSWPEPGVRIAESSILLFVGTHDAVERYSTTLASTYPRRVTGSSEDLTLVIGGGRVGRAVARKLQAAGMRHCIVEKRDDRVARHHDNVVIGDAAERQVLDRAGIHEASSIVVTTHDDDTNIYLTLYCRRLRPDADILGRVSAERNLSTIHRAGADLALSYATVGAAAVWNNLDADSLFVLAEGLSVLRFVVPEHERSQPLHRLAPPANNYSVVAARSGNDFTIQPDVQHSIEPGTELLIIGDAAAEAQVLTRLRGQRRRRGRPVRRQSPSEPTRRDSPDGLATPRSSASHYCELEKQ